MTSNTVQYLETVKC